MSKSWQRKRSEFNHDWLKNRYLTALAKWINILDGRVEDQEFEKQFTTAVLGQWREYSPQAIWLARSFESEMSPKALLERPPFINFLPESAMWLGDLVHGLWKSRYPVGAWVNEAATAVGAADDAYRNLLSQIGYGEVPTIEQLRALRSTFARFQGCCQAVAKAMEAFPSKVLAT
jgi:hypothetical protein